MFLEGIPKFYSHSCLTTKTVLLLYTLCMIDGC